MQFEFPIDIHVFDIDAYGIVYHAKYLEYMDMARTAWLKQLGFGLASCQKAGVLFVIQKVQLDYLKPAKISDSLIVSSEIKSIRKVALTYQQTICERENHATIFCRGMIDLVCVDANLKPKLLPSALRGETHGVN